MSEAWFGLLGAIIGGLLSLVGTVGVELFRTKEQQKTRGAELFREQVIALQEQIKLAMTTCHRSRTHRSLGFIDIDIESGDSLLAMIVAAARIENAAIQKRVDHLASYLMAGRDEPEPSMSRLAFDSAWAEARTLQTELTRLMANPNHVVPMPSGTIEDKP